MTFVNTLNFLGSVIFLMELKTMMQAEMHSCYNLHNKPLGSHEYKLFCMSVQRKCPALYTIQILPNKINVEMMSCYFLTGVH